MTYVLGINDDRGVHIFADTAISVRGGDDDSVPKTSFGELNARETDSSVYEGGIKIIRRNEIAYALCGDVAAARDVVDVLQAHLSADSDPRCALADVVAETKSLLDSRGPRVLVAGVWSDTPRLFAVGGREPGERIQEVPLGAHVQLGSLSPRYRKIFSTVIPGFSQSSLDLSSFIASSLGAIHSCSANDYLLSDGVGGAFTALTIRREGMRWQPDCLFVVYDQKFSNPNIVASGIRDNALITQSAYTGKTRAFIDTLSEMNLLKWEEMYSSFNFLDAVNFDFVVLIRLVERRVVTLEMKGQTDSANFRYWVVKDDAGAEVNMQLSPPLFEKLTSPLALPPDTVDDGGILFNFTFVHYRPFEKSAVGSKVTILNRARKSEVNLLEEWPGEP